MQQFASDMCSAHNWCFPRIFAVKFADVVTLGLSANVLLIHARWRF